MTEPPARQAKLKAASTVVGAIFVLAGLALAFLGAATMETTARWLVISGGCLAGLVGLAMIVVTSLLLKIESNTFRFYSLLLDTHELTRREAELLEKIVENTALSDAAKSLANRDQESEALRAVIHTHVRTEQWDAALTLVDNMEERFGHSDETGSLRQEIDRARVETMRQRLSEATVLIQGHLDAYEWDKALHEIERLHRALPDEPRIARLRSLYDTSRAARKSALLKTWNSAVERDDVDGAIDVLQDIDSYLTREEARSLEESARGVFKAKLMQLRMQFQFAVNDQRWRDALEIGVQISEEYPNSRMSHEVSEVMDKLRKRAGLPADVEVTAPQKERQDRPVQ